MWPAKKGEGAHELGTANSVLRGGPGKGKGGRARNWHSEFCASGARRISCAEVPLSVKRGELRGGAPSMWPQRRGRKACTKLVQRISCLGVVLAREKGGAHEIGTANFVLQGAPGLTKIVAARQNTSLLGAGLGNARTPTVKTLSNHGLASALRRVSPWSPTPLAWRTSESKKPLSKLAAFQRLLFCI